MNEREKLKKIVRKKYESIAGQQSQCCGSSCGCEEADYTIFSENYSSLKGYNREADLGLGCGLPTEHADLQPGQVVVDLGSGAGNDCFIVRHMVGETGRIIGIDMTEAMVNRARSNAAKLGVENVDFVLGDIEAIPLETSLADVVISNCVLNLVPDKTLAFQEIFRILKPGGHFSVSDIVTSGYLPPELKKDADLYAGCVSGAIEKGAYMHIIEAIGFVDIKVKKEVENPLPEYIIAKYDSLRLANQEGHIGKMLSITVNARKPY